MMGDGRMLSGFSEMMRTLIPRSLVMSEMARSFALVQVGAAPGQPQKRKRRDSRPDCDDVEQACQLGRARNSRTTPEGRNFETLAFTRVDLFSCANIYFERCWPQPWEGWGYENKSMAGTLCRCRAMRLSN